MSNMLKCNPKKIEIIHSPRLFHRPNQFLLSRLEIVQEFLGVMKSKTLLSHLTAILILKLTSTTFVAPPHVLFVKSKIGVLMRLKYLIPTLLSKLRIYQSFILPQLTYCQTVWRFWKIWLEKNDWKTLRESTTGSVYCALIPR